MKKKNLLVILLFLLFVTIAFSDSRVEILNFKILNKNLTVNFRLREVANPALVKLIMAEQAVRIYYNISIYRKRGFLRANQKVWGVYNIFATIKYKRFARVFTINYKHGEKKIKKRFRRTRNNRKTVRKILKYFFNKIYTLKIPISTLDRNHDHILTIITRIASIRLRPPYGIINSTFNFQVKYERAF